MIVNWFSPSPTDPASLAADVRKLASDAHHLLTRPTCKTAELHGLMRRIARIRTQVRRRETTDLAEWLATLHQHVEERLAATPGAVASER